MGDRILYFISESFPPLGRGGPRIAASFARYLARDGWMVRAVTAGARKGFFLQWEHDYDLLESISREVDIREVKPVQWGVVGEVLAATGVIPSIMAHWVPAVARKLGKIVAPGVPGMVCAMYPDIANCYVGLEMKRRYGFPLVVNLRDNLPGALSRTKRSGRRWARRERVFVSGADLLFVATESVKRDLIERHSCPSEKIEVVYNGYDEPIDVAARQHVGDVFRVAYAGTIARAQRPEILNRAYRRLLKRHPELTGRIEVDIYGQRSYYFHSSFKPTLRAGITFHGFMPHRRLQRLLADTTDVGFFSLADERYAYAMPTKLFDLVNLEKPMVAALPPGEARDMIIDTGIGLVSHYADIDGVASNLYRLYSDRELFGRCVANLHKMKPRLSIQSQVQRMSRTMRERIG